MGKRKTAYQAAIDSSPRAVALKACSTASEALDAASAVYCRRPTEATRAAMAAADRALMAAQATAHTR